MIIRKVRPSDAAPIADIYNYYVEETTVSFEYVPVSAGEMAARIAETSAEYPYFVCEEDGKVAGYCYAHRWKERPAYSRTWETTVYLSSRSRGRGIGRLLMERLVEECRAAGCHVLVACITGDNDASMRFHERLGFVRASCFHQVGHKFGCWLDVADYELLLSR